MIGVGFAQRARELLTAAGFDVDYRESAAAHNIDPADVSRGARWLARAPPAMREAVICEPLRTPVGRFGGVFRDVPATALAATVIGELVARTGVCRRRQIDDVLIGQCYPNGEAPAIGRVAALDAGLPVEVPGCRSTAAAARACRR